MLAAVVEPVDSPELLPVTVALPAELAEWTDRTAGELRKSRSGMIRAALVFLRRHEAALRAQGKLATDPGAPSPADSVRTCVSLDHAAVKWAREYSARHQGRASVAFTVRVALFSVRESI